MHVAIENLVVNFTTPAGETLPALGSISVAIESTSFVAVLGPSGCGKSTLIRVVAGLQAATSGRVWLDESLVQEPSPSAALMFQDANLMPWRTVEDNIALPLELQGISKEERLKTAHSLLPHLGLVGFEHSYPSELSGGMAQRVALGRVLIQNPEMLLLDEPFGALDALTRERIGMDLLQVWSQRKQTVIMVTHDINEAVLLADRILILTQRPGRLLEDITVPLARPRTLDDIYTEPFLQTAKQVRQAIDRA